MFPFSKNKSPMILLVAECVLHKAFCNAIDRQTDGQTSLMLTVSGNR